MQFLELSSDHSSFNTIKFNPTGLSLIVGSKSDTGKGDIQKTYNGVGKSLMIELIHFCLASNSKENFSQRLPDWTFTLKFIVNKIRYEVSRNTSSQDRLFLNGNIISATDFRTLFGKELFYLDGSLPTLSFRSLASKFIRRGKADYVSFYGREDNKYSNRLCISYLLGLDVERSIKKYTLQNDIDKLAKSKKLIEEDPFLKEHFSGAIQLELIDFEEKIKHIEDSLKSYQVAEDYHQIRIEADDLSKQIRNLANKEFSIQRALENIEKSLSLKPDIETQEIERIYQEAKTELHEMVKKRLVEVLEFHNSLLTSRAIRLERERTKLRGQLEEIKKQRELLSSQENRLLAYLSSHGALEEFTALNIQLAEVRDKKSKLSVYNDFLLKYDQHRTRLKTTLLSEDANTELYLSTGSGSNVRQNNLETFRKFSKEFYKDKPTGIIIETDKSSKSKQRYDIKVKIEDDASDGINEVKIFCFDWTILVGQRNHCFKSLLHDSRLFSDMDARQAATALRLAHEISNRHGYQYIASLNQDRLNSIRNEFEEYDNIETYDEIAKSVVMHLTDESHATKLLGIEVDLDYDK